MGLVQLMQNGMRSEQKAQVPFAAGIRLSSHVIHIVEFEQSIHFSIEHCKQVFAE